MKKYSIIISIVVLLIAVYFVVTNRSVTNNEDADLALASFNDIVQNNKELKTFHKELMHWGLEVAPNEKIEWTKDPSANKADFAIVIEADPFINAGLDVNRIVEFGWKFEKANGKTPNLLIKPYNISNKKSIANGSEDSMRRLLKIKPSMIEVLEDQYALHLNQIDSIKWNKSSQDQSNDITFEIDAQSFIDSSVDVNMLNQNGWIYVESNGNKLLIKNYDL